MWYEFVERTLIVSAMVIGRETIEPVMGAYARK